ncbi:hypothetical protein HELRODRAFT_148066, partial [Helobdella robusta]|uniref:Uncharacterized protein n=1 Tax=Helobdella robusta TaxID=6412 RepID=T1EK43_HELRO
NRITLGGASKIADLLKQNTNLQTLDLSFNLISDEGAVNIAQALALYNTNLIKLSVVKNELTGKGLCSLAQCLFNNQTLQEMYVTGNQADEAACIVSRSIIS